jgi:putative ABC transport system substrate-binding protein
MRRRQFITLLGGAAALPIAARAQQRERVRSVGILMPLAPDDPEDQARLAAFLQGLQENGWSVGQNLRIDTRWGNGNSDLIQKSAGELAALAPDVILSLTLADLSGVSEGIFHSVPDMARNFDTISARP